MMNIESITPLILTYNEEPNIDRTLKKLYWANEIIIIDSYSNDRTLDIAKSYPQVKIFQRKFDTHACQWNFGLAQVSSEWVISLDADYVLSDSSIESLSSAIANPDLNGYFIPFKYCVFGKPLKNTILPPRLALFRKDSAIYIDDGHTQLLQLRGRSSQLETFIYHDDRKQIDRWLQSQIKYAQLEVHKLLTTPPEQLTLVEKIRLKKILAPLIMPIYCLVVKGGILDGWHGLYYAAQRTLAELMLSVCLIDKKLESK